MPSLRARILVLLLVLLVGLTACGDESDDVETGAAEVPSEEPAASTAPAEGTDIRTDDAGVVVADDLATKPTIELPGGEPPSGLVVHDVVEGDGDAASPTATVETQYVGVCWSDGEQFDASWDSGGAISFSLDGVIQGWTQGIPGMKVGGRRLLVIPGELAYGLSGPCAEAGGAMAFAIDLVSTQG